MRVAIVTNIPAPYRLPVYQSLAEASGIELCLFFASGREPDREWNVNPIGFTHQFLKQKFLTMKGRYIHFNPDVWSALREFSPEIVITTGFNPTHLIAYAYARWYSKQHITMTDGTLQSEQKLSGLHRLIRRIVYANSAGFIGASNGSMQLYQSYSLPLERCFKSHLCADNAMYSQAPESTKNMI